MPVRRGLCGLAFLAFLSACVPTGGLSTAEGGIPSVDAGGHGVAGLEVGHQLMAAGEFELALKAYYRAAAEDGISVDTLSAIGSANLQLGRLGQAEQVLRDALDMDPDFVPALNNLGVVLAEQGKWGEAKLVFQEAYALDSGQTDSIRENLKLAIAKLEAPLYGDPEPETGEPAFDLIQGDNGEYVLLSRY